MSFKREGNDEALLHKLQINRVRELLSEHIPDDEALLLSNGRLTCLICSHRPIFDTFGVLASHRKGKKHINELGKYLQHKRDMEYRKLKSDHRQYLQSDSSNRNPNKKHCHEKFMRKSVLSVSVPTPGGVETKSDPPVIRSTSSEVRHYLKGVQRKRALQKTVEKCREHYSMQHPCSLAETSRPESSDTLKKSNIKRKLTSSVASDSVSRDLQLRMSGWIKLPNGKWAKDPEAEFDSDEESPDDCVV